MMMMGGTPGQNPQQMQNLMGQPGRVNPAFQMPPGAAGQFIMPQQARMMAAMRPQMGQAAQMGPQQIAAA